jgi:hypothetical protein
MISTQIHGATKLMITILLRIFASRLDRTVLHRVYVWGREGCGLESCVTDPGESWPIGIHLSQAKSIPVDPDRCGQ